MEKIYARSCTVDFVPECHWIQETEFYICMPSLQHQNLHLLESDGKPGAEKHFSLKGKTKDQPESKVETDYRKEEGREREMRKERLR